MSESKIPFFSIVIPTFNSSKTIERAIHSLKKQSISQKDFEVLLVDDGSTDNTLSLLKIFKDSMDIRVFKTSVSSGPGIARNKAIKHARGSWIVFLDSDDELKSVALEEIKNIVESNVSFDLVGYGGLLGNDTEGYRSFRLNEGALLIGPKRELLREYLHLRMDGSVIFTAVRTELLKKHNIIFEESIHEDIDFLFKLYLNAKKIGFLANEIYIKNKTDLSITSTISIKHLGGFFRAFTNIANYIDDLKSEFPELSQHLAGGLNSLVATRLREIHKLKKPLQEKYVLYNILAQKSHEFRSKYELKGGDRVFSKYNKLEKYLLTYVKNCLYFDETKTIEFENQITNIMKKSWSCKDLQHSIFLGPNQIRTCCKRFFRNGKMHGDAVLFDVPKGSQVSGDDITKSKKTLIAAINRGDETECTGCPFLEFKEWEAFKIQSLDYISLEYHSVCNLRCSYCSETYYGGAKANYNVSDTVTSLLIDRKENQSLTVVWGGGEPTIDQEYSQLMDIFENKCPNAKHRVLTNSVKFSSKTDKLLNQKKISIVTSIDAGTQSKFRLIRGSDKMNEVLSNLKRYAQHDPSLVTVKYIFTDENSSGSEIQSFIENISEYSLINCNFQISSNFKEESISLEKAALMVLLYSKLTDIGAKVIFFDDLIRHRLSYIQSHDEIHWSKQLEKYGIKSVIADPRAFPDVIVWGAGWQAKYLKNNTSFFKTSRIKYFIDETPSKIGASYLGTSIKSPTDAINDEDPIVIAAVQGYPDIYASFHKYGINLDRLVKKLII
jgi:glycosyltransferase involved in cell wall biosynthesis/organic radical activating enzyme